MTLTSKTIAELRDGFRGGEFSAREVAESFNAAVAGARALNAFTVETPEEALAAAEAVAQLDDCLGSEAGHQKLVIASEAKQSSLAPLDCRVATLLAMTGEK